MHLDLAYVTKLRNLTKTFDFLIFFYSQTEIEESTIIPSRTNDSVHIVTFRFLIRLDSDGYI